MAELVDKGYAFDDLAIGRDEFVSFDAHQIALA